MNLPYWISRRAQDSLQHPKPNKRGRSTSPRPFVVEHLEDRCTPAVLTVTTIDDVVADDGQLSLREAIMAANTDTTVDGATGSGADQIMFDSSLAGGTIRLNSQLEITSIIDILGDYKSPIISGDSLADGGLIGAGDADGHGDTRIFYVSSSGSFIIRSLKLFDGYATDNGGAIFGESGSSITISGSTLSGNHAELGGGAVYGMSVGVDFSTISGNSTGEAGGSAIAGHATDINSTVYIYNSTISGNVGGGVTTNTSNIFMLYATIYGNTNGAGFAVQSHILNSLTMHSSIIVGNTDSQGEADFIINTSATDVRNNVFGATNLLGGTNLRNIAAEDVIETTLADNGGPTLTHALVADSVAIGYGVYEVPTTGPHSTGVAIDQTLSVRNLTTGLKVNAGAVEYVSHPLTGEVGPLYFAENQVGSVATLTADNGGTAPFTWSILDVNGEAYDPDIHPFVLDPATGELAVIDPLDFEMLANHSLNVHVTDGTLTDIRRITVIVTDAVDFSPVGPVAVQLGAIQAGKSGPSNVAGSADLTGANLDLNLAGFNAFAGESFTVLTTSGGITGNFANLSAGRYTQEGITFEVANRGNAIVLTVVAQPTANSTSYVQQLYWDILGRQADTSGLQSWVAKLNSGVSRQEIASAFYRSAEHRAMQINEYYQTYLGRDADAAGLRTWGNMFAAGANESDIIRSITSSAEYYNRHGGSNESFVRSLYSHHLGRDVDTQGLNTWVTSLDNGATRSEVVSNILDSVEHRRRLIDSAYDDHLRRDVDDVGQAGWLSALSGDLTQDELDVAIFSSDEYFIRS